MLKYTGKSIKDAIAVGKAVLYKRKTPTVKRFHVDDTEGEIQRIETAKKTAIEQLEVIYKETLSEVGKSNAQIFEIHIMLIQDDDYNDSILGILNTQHVNAEYAVAVTSDNFSQMFAEMDDAYMRARAADIKDVSNRIITNLIGKSEQNKYDDQGFVLCANDLVPSEAVHFGKNKVLAFLTAEGFSHSHTAILAKNMNIPAIVGLGTEFLSAVRDGGTIIVDGCMGDVIVDPDGETVERYLEKKKAEEERQRLYAELKGKDNFTKDGTAVTVCANIDRPGSIGAVIYSGADGIGFFPSDCLKTAEGIFPSEEEQFRIYKRITESMSGKKVGICISEEGLCEGGEEILNIQLKALYRASAYGRLGIIFPEVKSKGSFTAEKISEICGRIKEELIRDKTEISDSVEIGLMINNYEEAVEIFSAAKRIDFISIGADSLDVLLPPCHSEESEEEKRRTAFRIIGNIADYIHRNAGRIEVCGKIAADTDFTEIFLRMGIDELSTAPDSVLKVRDAVRKIDLSNPGNTLY